MLNRKKDVLVKAVTVGAFLTGEGTTMEDNKKQEENQGLYRSLVAPQVEPILGRVDERTKLAREYLSKLFTVDLKAQSVEKVLLLLKHASIYGMQVKLNLLNISTDQLRLILKSQYAQSIDYGAFTYAYLSAQPEKGTENENEQGFTKGDIFTGGQKEKNDRRFYQEALVPCVRTIFNEVDERANIARKNLSKLFVIDLSKRSVIEVLNLLRYANTYGMKIKLNLLNINVAQWKFILKGQYAKSIDFEALKYTFLVDPLAYAQELDEEGDQRAKPTEAPTPWDEHINTKGLPDISSKRAAARRRDALLFEEVSSDLDEKGNPLLREDDSLANDDSSFNKNKPTLVSWKATLVENAKKDDNPLAKLSYYLTTSAHVAHPSHNVVEVFCRGKS